MEAVIFIGIPGSGKTTFFRERFFEDYVCISKDLLRTRHREQVFLQACLSTQQRFVVDNTNVLAAERSLYIPQAKAARFRVTGYVFDTALKDALRRNAQRQGKAVVPRVGVVSKYKQFELPTLHEGFDEIYSLSINEENRFVVLPWLTGNSPEAGS
ncbi:MAG: putative kinase [Bryobacterales bacterium]|jgi:predicted kinase|nr:putative kinase [Bryobacterales bacterium]